jgi:hypothetical protein
MAGFAPTPALGSSSLRWVRSLLPGEEGRAWWAEVISCLSEITEPAQRRQYVRSYRRSVPQLVWTSWTSGVRGVAPAGAGYRSVDWKGTTIENFDPEEKFGIKEQGGPGPRSLDQKYPYFSVLQHWFLGSLGYPDGLHELHQDTSRAISDSFRRTDSTTSYISPGLFWLLGAFALTPPGIQGMNIAVGGALLLVTVLGFLDYWSLLSIPPGINGDNILDLAVAVATLIVGGGLLSAGSRRATTA